MSLLSERFLLLDFLNKYSCRLNNSIELFCNQIKVMVDNKMGESKEHESMHAIRLIYKTNTHLTSREKGILVSEL